VRAEILSQPLESGEMRQLHDRILRDPAVQAAFGWRQPDGWLGRNFHGASSVETAIRLLCEKGVRRDHPVLAGALIALVNATPEQLSRGIGKVGPYFDAANLGGSRMIQAAVLSYAGMEELPLVQAQIRLALSAFEAVLAFESCGDAFEPYRGQCVLRPGTAWPGIYHLRLLAHTRSWRTPETTNRLAECVQRLVEFSPLPAYHVRRGSQLIAPASYAMLDFNSSLANLDGAGWAMWFHRMEVIARLGVMPRVPALNRQAVDLQEMLAGTDGWFTMNFDHRYFKLWGAYTGLMLEPDWRSPQRRVNDLTFRSLLILHHAGELIQ
jgi:hypothetical protein